MEPKVGIAPGPGVNERGHAESLRKARELTTRRGSFIEVHEMRFRAAFGEEAERLARLRALSREEIWTSMCTSIGMKF